MRGYAYYSPATDAPPGGLCLSAFAIARKGPAFLALQPRDHPKWAEWAPNWDVYEPQHRAQQFHLWRLPSSYLKEGEHPDATLQRILRDQLGARDATVQGMRVHAFHDASSRFPGQKHWDLCFVYDVACEPPAPGSLPWLGEARWVQPHELRPSDFGSAIGDLAQELGLLAEHAGTRPARNL